jgi:hypothetical protein
MSPHILRPVIFVLIFFLLMVIPGSAAVNNVPAGGSVFIGEQGLSIANITSGSSIGWWESASVVPSSEPAYQILVTDSTNFFIDPSIFSSRTGYWYKVSDKSPVFNVVDPYLQLKIYDVTVSSDRTGTWIPWGDEVRFQINTNLYEMANRGVSGAPVTIKIKSPQGAVFTSVVNKSGGTTSLVDIAVGSSPYYTVPAWDTGNNLYSYGSYTIWAECNANNMKDNYNIVGKTTTASDSDQVNVQDINPNIKTVTPTTATPTTVQTTLTETTIPTTMPSITETTVPMSPSVTIQPMTSEIQETLPPDTMASPTPTRASGFGSILAIYSLLGVSGIGIYQIRKAIVN